MNKKISILFFCVCVFLANAQIFVKTTGSDSNDGKTWETALATLDAAILKGEQNTITSGNSKKASIYIAGGTYIKKGTSGTLMNNNMPASVDYEITGAYPTNATGIDVSGYDPTRYKTYFKLEDGALLGADAMFVLNATNGNMSFKGINLSNVGNKLFFPIYNSVFFNSYNAANKTYTFEDITFYNVDTADTMGMINLGGSAQNNTVNLINVVGRTNIEKGTLDSTVKTGRMVKTDNETGGNKINIRNSDFKNIFTIENGAILNIDGLSNNPNFLTVENSYFCNITAVFGTYGVATGNGGSVYAKNAVVKLVNNKFSGNEGLAGNAIFLRNAELYSEGNEYTANTRSGSAAGQSTAGAIAISGTPTWSTPKITSDKNYLIRFINDKFHDNSTGIVDLGSGGGAIHIQDYVRTTARPQSGIYISGAEFLNNRSINGGAIFAQNTTLFIENSKFVGNKASNAVALSGRGGAISIESGSLSLKNNCFTNNTSINSGGALRIENINNDANTSGTDFNNFVVNIDTNKFHSNSISYGGNIGGGGAIQIRGAIGIGRVNISNTEFYSNASQTHGVVGFGGGALQLYIGSDANNNKITSFVNNKFAGNTHNGDASTINNNGGADIKTYFGRIENITNSVMQLASQSNYNNPSDLTFSTGNTFGGVSPIPANVCTINGMPSYCSQTREDITNTRTITAVPDLYLVYFGSTTTIRDILANDNLNGNTPTIADVTVTFANPSNSNITYDNTTGEITVGPNTPEGIHTIDYTICDKADSTSCSTTTVTIVVEKSPICFGDASLTTGSDSKHGITSLQRAATAINLSDGWPMVRKSAWTVLESNTKGFVITRMTTAQINAIAHPQDGMMTYDTTEKCLKIYDGTEWACFSTATCP
ncbi:MAG: hypothetical protein Q4G16_01195 [Cruoricaptor ignavus]|nr:hypothetical protein [Cruoricaptor ignavus]